MSVPPSHPSEGGPSFDDALRRVLAGRTPAPTAQAVPAGQSASPPPHVAEGIDDWHCTCGSHTVYHTFACLWPKTLGAVADVIDGEDSFTLTYRKLESQRDRAYAERDALRAERDEAERKLLEAVEAWDLDLLKHTTQIRTERDAAEGRAAGMREDADALVKALAEFVDDEPCHLDHHGACQGHGFSTAPCGVDESRKLLAKMLRNHDRAPSGSGEAGNA